MKSANGHDIELAEPLPDDITSTEREKFLAFLAYYSDVIAANSDDLGGTNVLQHHINTGVSPPAITTSTTTTERYSPSTPTEIHSRNVISSSKSPWASASELITEI